MSQKALLIVDPQIDFIEGTLPVPGAVDAMNDLAVYVNEHGHEYPLIIVTADHHPLHHCSFNTEGGPWAEHCIRNSVGAAFWPPLFQALHDYNGYVHTLYKGQSINRDEYSVFKNPSVSVEIRAYIREMNISRIDICGIAGDFCVSDTLVDAIKYFNSDMFNLLRRFTPSFDGGNHLNGIVSRYNISVTD